MQLRLPVREWIRKHLAEASIPEEKMDAHEHGVWTFLDRKAPFTLEEKFEPITEEQFVQKYGRHVVHYLQLTRKGKVAFDEKPPIKTQVENQRWFGIDGDTPRN